MQNSHRSNFKPFNASRYSVGIVVAQFNRDITEAMLRKALAELRKYKVSKKQIKIFRVAGVVEIPVVLQALAESGKFDAAIAVGAIIKGETDHYYYVADIVCRGVSEVVEEGMPVGFAVLTTENRAQAWARVAVGAEATIAALHAARTISQILEKEK